MADGREVSRKRKAGQVDSDATIEPTSLVTLRPAKLLEAVSPQDPITLARIVRFAELLRAEARGKLARCGKPCSYCTDSDDERWDDYYSSDDSDAEDTAKSTKVQAPIVGSCPCGSYQACEECVNSRRGYCSEITECTSCGQFLCGMCDESDACEECDAVTCRACVRGEGATKCNACGEDFIPQACKAAKTS